MEYRATLSYSESMVRRAVRVFIWRRLRVSLAIYVLLVVWVAVSWDTASFLSGFSVAVLLCLLLFFGLVWRAHWRNSVGKFRMLDPARADFTFRSTDLFAVSNQGSVSLPWSRFVEVWEQPGFWILLTGPNAFITLPLDGMTPEALDFVRGRLAGRFRFVRS